MDGSDEMAWCWVLGEKKQGLEIFYFEGVEARAGQSIIAEGGEVRC